MSNKGMTLVELMLVGILMFTVLGAIYIVEQTGEKFLESVSIKASLQSKANYALGMIVRCIKESRSAQIGINSLTLEDPYGYKITFVLNNPGGNGGEILYFDTRYGINQMKLIDGVSLLRFSSQDRGIRVEIQVEQKNRKVKLYSQSTFRSL